MLFSRLLSVRGKLRLLAEPWIARRPGGKRRLAAPGELDASLLDDESVASFAIRRLGRETFERLVQPLMAGIYTADPAKLSMAATMPQLLYDEQQYGSLLAGRWKAKREKQEEQQSGARYSLFVAPEHGMHSMVDAIARRLPEGTIRLNTTVTSISPTANQDWQLNLSNEGRPTEKPERFDGAVVALPAYRAAKLLGPCDARLGSLLAEIEYAGSSIVCLGYRLDQINHPLNAFGFVVPRVEGRKIIAGSFASLKFPGRAPEGHLLIRVFVGGALQPELADLPDDQLCQLAQEELADLLAITGKPQLAQVVRWPRSMPQYHVGHLQRVECIEQQAAKLPRLELAGNAYRGVGIPQCIQSGQSAAERLVADLQHIDSTALD